MDMSRTREIFEDSTDFTVGLEEEFSLLDPQTLELVDRYEELRDACVADPRLVDSVAGELIASEIEIRSGKGETFAEAVAMQATRREALFAKAADLGILLGSTGTHPFANYLDQEIIDTPHYNKLRKQLRWVAQRNNTWSLHAHVGVRGADRAIAVCDHLRGVLPILLAASSNSPFLDGHETGLHSVRTQIFTRTFPRCGIHQPFGDFATYADFIGLLAETGTATASTELWWSVRPHHSFGTVEVRICDAQTDAARSTDLSGLITACVAQSALDYDAGILPSPQAPREVEENLWRAIRFGMTGEMIDFAARKTVPTPEVLERLFEWTAPARDLIGLGEALPGRTGSEDAYAQIAEGVRIADIHADNVRRTQATYAGISVT